MVLRAGDRRASRPKTMPRIGSEGEFVEAVTRTITQGWLGKNEAPVARRAGSRPGQ